MNLKSIRETQTAFKGFAGRFATCKRMLASDWLVVCKIKCKFQPRLAYDCVLILICWPAADKKSMQVSKLSIDDLWNLFVKVTLTLFAVHVAHRFKGYKDLLCMVRVYRRVICWLTGVRCSN